jgi:murein DD-endopeptidase MepM/ murein hydrolase activator NlpD
MKPPLPFDIRKLRVNRTLHGRSRYRKANVSGHNVFLYYSTPGKGDGLDLFCPAGTPVFAMHSGRVTRISTSRNSRNTYVMVEGGGFYSFYAHIHAKESLKVGDSVKTGQILGWVGRILNDAHVHLEAGKGGVPVSASTAKKLREKFVELCKNG